MNRIIFLLLALVVIASFSMNVGAASRFAMDRLLDIPDWLCVIFVVAISACIIGGFMCGFKIGGFFK